MNRERRPSILAVSLTLLMAASLVGIAIAWRQWGTAPQTVLAMPLDSPARPSPEAVDWCLGTSPAGPAMLVATAGREFLGMRREISDTGLSGLRDDPLFPQSCALAYEIWGLASPDEWDWCFDVDNRAAWLEPAVKLLGLGEKEEAGTETFGEAPGDSPAEYVQACRFAYRYARPIGAIPVVDARSHPFLALSAEASTWCDAHPWAIEAAVEALEIGVTPAADTASIPEREAFVRACRFARIRDAAS
jgi:hypothetical protein